MDSLALWFAETLGQYVSGEVVIFLISMVPILELRGGLLVAWSIGVPLMRAIPICIIGNIIPIPFILLFIRKIFQLMKRFHIFPGLVDRMEQRAMKRSDAIRKYEFWGLVLFVGIPLPGTGAWTGSLIAALLEVDVKKAVLAELLGIAIATFLVSIFSYGLLGNMVG